MTNNLLIGSYTFVPENKKSFIMKKMFLAIALIAGVITIAVAQTTPKKKVETENGKAKVKPNTTIKDKAHNVIHPKKKRAHGVKAKHKTGDAKVKTSVKTSNS